MDAVETVAEVTRTLASKHCIFSRDHYETLLREMRDIIEPQKCESCDGAGMIDGVILCPKCAESPQDILDAVRAAHSIIVGDKKRM